MERIKVISIVGEHEDGNLWFDVTDKETPQLLFDYIMSNFNTDQPYELVVGEVSKKDYDEQD